MGIVSRVTLFLFTIENALSLFLSFFLRFQLSSSAFLFFSGRPNTTSSTENLCSRSRALIRAITPARAYPLRFCHPALINTRDEARKKKRSAGGPTKRSAGGRREGCEPAKPGTTKTAKSQCAVAVGVSGWVGRAGGYEARGESGTLKQIYRA